MIMSELMGGWKEKKGKELGMLGMSGWELRGRGGMVVDKGKVGGLWGEEVSKMERR